MDKIYLKSGNGFQEEYDLKCQLRNIIHNSLLILFDRWCHQQLILIMPCLWLKEIVIEMILK